MQHTDRELCEQIIELSQGWRKLHSGFDKGAPDPRHHNPLPLLQPLIDEAHRRTDTSEFCRAFLELAKAAIDRDTNGRADHRQEGSWINAARFLTAISYKIDTSLVKSERPHSPPPTSPSGVAAATL